MVLDLDVLVLEEVFEASKAASSSARDEAASAAAWASCTSAIKLSVLSSFLSLEEDDLEEEDFEDLDDVVEEEEDLELLLDDLSTR